MIRRQSCSKSDEIMSMIVMMMILNESSARMNRICRSSPFDYCSERYNGMIRGGSQSNDHEKIWLLTTDKATELL